MRVRVRVRVTVTVTVTVAVTAPAAATGAQHRRVVPAQHRAARAAVGAAAGPRNEASNGSSHRERAAEVARLGGREGGREGGRDGGRDGGRREGRGRAEGGEDLLPIPHAHPHLRPNLAQVARALSHCDGARAAQRGRPVSALPRHRLRLASRGPRRGGDHAVLRARAAEARAARISIIESVPHPGVGRTSEAQVGSIRAYLES